MFSPTAATSYSNIHHLSCRVRGQHLTCTIMGYITWHAESGGQHLTCTIKRYITWHAENRGTHNMQHSIMVCYSSIIGISTHITWHEICPSHPLHLAMQILELFIIVLAQSWGDLRMYSLGLKGQGYSYRGDEWHSSRCFGCGWEWTCLQKSFIEKVNMSSFSELWKYVMGIRTKRLFSMAHDNIVLCV